MSLKFLFFYLAGASQQELKALQADAALSISSKAFSIFTKANLQAIFQNQFLNIMLLSSEQVHAVLNSPHYESLPVQVKEKLVLNSNGVLMM